MQYNSSLEDDSTPLKGKYLESFFFLSEVSAGIGLKNSNPNLSPSEQQVLGRMHTTMRVAQKKISAHLLTKKELSRADLTQILEDTFKTANDESDLIGVIHEVTQKRQILSDNHARATEFDEALVAALKTSLNYFFLIALAVQEKSEKLLIDGMSENLRYKINDFIERYNTNDPNILNNDQIGYALGHAAGELVHGIYMLEGLKKKGSPLVGLYQDLLFGDRTAPKEKQMGVLQYLDALIIVSLQMDPTKKAEMERMKIYRQELMINAASNLGVQIPKYAELG